MNLDVIAAVLCGLMAGLFFQLHSLSSPKRKSWMTLPAHVRIGLFLSGAALMVWSANLTVLAPMPLVRPGHMNWVGLSALATFTYTMAALTYWLAQRLLRNQGWDKVETLVEAETQGAQGMVAKVVTEGSTDVLASAGAITDKNLFKPGADRLH